MDIYDLESGGKAPMITEMDTKNLNNPIKHNYSDYESKKIEK